MKMHRVWLLVAALLVSLALPPPAHGGVAPSSPSAQERQAPNAQGTVAAVIAAHPEIDACDEVRRGAIVDYAAQRLNARGLVVWGRKSRGRPNGTVAVNPNTDGLTYLRSDGRFEIYDAIAGKTPSSPACGATWEGYGPFSPGENGYWAPPQLGPETGTGPTPTPTPAGGVTRAELDAAIAKLANDLRIEIGALLVHVGDRLEALEARPPLDLPGLQAAIETALANYEVAGSTSSKGLGPLAHSHTVKLALTKKRQP